MSILTFNAGLLRVSLFSRILAEPTPFIEERFESLTRCLCGVDADVIALQEIYFPQHRDFLSDQLRDRYPFSARHDRRVWPNVGNGLLLFSRFPLANIHYMRYSDVDWQERVFVGKGALFATVYVPAIGEVAISTVHTTAGGFVDTQSRQANSWRNASLVKTIRALRRHNASARILLGDFNAGPQASRENYNALLLAGFMDAAAAAGCSEVVTWDPGNPLNSGGPHADCPPQRIDHILVDMTAPLILQPRRAELAFAEPIVESRFGRRTLSDHYGVLVNLESAPE